MAFHCVESKLNCLLSFLFLFFKFYFLGFFCIYFLSIYCLKNIYHIFITSLQTFNRSQQGSSKPQPRSGSPVNGSAPGSPGTGGAWPARGRPPFPSSTSWLRRKNFQPRTPFPWASGCATLTGHSQRDVGSGPPVHSPFGGILFYWFFSCVSYFKWNCY